MDLKAKLKQFGWNLLVMLDRVANTVTGGSPEMTVSGRMGKAVAEGRCVLCKGVCWLLGLIDTNHCAKAAKSEANLGQDEVVRL